MPRTGSDRTKLSDTLSGTPQAERTVRRSSRLAQKTGLEPVVPPTTSDRVRSARTESSSDPSSEPDKEPSSLKVCQRQRAGNRGTVSQKDGASETEQAPVAPVETPVRLPVVRRRSRRVQAAKDVPVSEPETATSKEHQTARDSAAPGMHHSANNANIPSAQAGSASVAFAQTTRKVFPTEEPASDSRHPASASAASASASASAEERTPAISANASVLGTGAPTSPSNGVLAPDYRRSASTRDRRLSEQVDNARPRAEWLREAPPLSDACPSLQQPTAQWNRSQRKRDPCSDSLGTSSSPLRRRRVINTARASERVTSSTSVPPTPTLSPASTQALAASAASTADTGYTAAGKLDERCALSASTDDGGDVPAHRPCSSTAPAYRDASERPAEKRCSTDVREYRSGHAASTWNAAHGRAAGLVPHSSQNSATQSAAAAAAQVSHPVAPKMRNQGSRCLSEHAQGESSPDLREMVLKQRIRRALASVREPLPTTAGDTGAEPALSDASCARFPVQQSTTVYADARSQMSCASGLDRPHGRSSNQQHQHEHHQQQLRIRQRSPQSQVARDAHRCAGAGPLEHQFRSRNCTPDDRHSSHRESPQRKRMPNERSAMIAQAPVRAVFPAQGTALVDPHASKPLLMASKHEWALMASAKKASPSPMPLRAHVPAATEPREHYRPPDIGRVADEAAKLVKAAAAAGAGGAGGGGGASTEAEPPARMATRAALGVAAHSSDAEAELLCMLWLHGPDVSSQPARRLILRNLPPSTNEHDLYSYLVHVMAATCCFAYDYIGWHQRFAHWHAKQRRAAGMLAAAGRYRQQSERLPERNDARGPGVNESSRGQAQSSLLRELRLTPVWELQVLWKSRTAFVECLTVQETTGLVQLSGLLFQGYQIVISRPREFDAELWLSSNPLPAEAAEALRLPPARFHRAAVAESQMSPNVWPASESRTPAGAFYGHIRGIPLHLTEYTMIQWLRTALVGWPWQLSAFHLAREGRSGLSRGFAHFRLDRCRAADCTSLDQGVTNATQAASEMRTVASERFATVDPEVERLVEHLRSHLLPGVSRPLIIRQANPMHPRESKSTPEAPDAQGEACSPRVPHHAASAADFSENASASMVTAHVDGRSTEASVLALVRLLRPELFADTQERTEAIDDVTEELRQYGSIEEVALDERPNEPEAGTVYVRFTKAADAAAAADAMQHRRFEQRPVNAELLSVFDMRARLGDTRSMQQTVVVLPEVVDPQAFLDEEERADIAMDIREEMLQFAEKVEVEIPLPPHPEAGAAFIRFPDRVSAEKALSSLQGRFFDGRPVRPYLR